MQNLSDHQTENFLKFSKHSKLLILVAFGVVLRPIKKKQGYLADPVDKRFCNTQLRLCFLF